MEIHANPDPSRRIEDQDELVLMALTCRAEARGEHDIPRWASASDPSALEEMLAVAWVIMNRADRRHQSVRSVVLAPKQFSCWNLSDPSRTETTRFIATGPSTQDSWRTSLSAAFLAYTRMAPDISMGADHYYSVVIPPPSWAPTMKEVSRWGRHVFFDSKKKP